MCRRWARRIARHPSNPSMRLSSPRNPISFFATSFVRSSDSRTNVPVTSTEIFRDRSANRERNGGSRRTTRATNASRPLFGTSRYAPSESPVGPPTGSILSTSSIHSGNALRSAKSSVTSACGALISSSTMLFMTDVPTCRICKGRSARPKPLSPASEQEQPVSSFSPKESHMAACRFGVGLLPSAVLVVPAPALAQDASQDSPQQIDWTPSFRSLLTGLGNDFQQLTTSNSFLIMGIGGAAAFGTHTFDKRISTKNLGGGSMAIVFGPGQIVGGIYAQAGAAFATYVAGRATHSPRLSQVGAELVRAQFVAQGVTQTMKF